MLSRQYFAYDIWRIPSRYGFLSCRTAVSHRPGPLEIICLECALLHFAQRHSVLDRHSMRLLYLGTNGY